MAKLNNVNTESRFERVDTGNLPAMDSNGDSTTEGGNFTRAARDKCYFCVTTGCPAKQPPFCFPCREGASSELPLETCGQCGALRGPCWLCFDTVGWGR